MLKLALVGFCVWIWFATLEAQLGDQMMTDKQTDETKRDILKKKLVNAKVNRKTAESEKVMCEPTPLETLNRILGPAFNARYMAVEKPVEERQREAGDVVDGGTGDPNEQRDARMIRHDAPVAVAVGVDDFAVDPKFSRVLTDGILSREKKSVQLDSGNDENEEKKQAMIWTNMLDTMRKEKPKTTETKSGNVPWTCESRVDWIDLGKDYFPRYLRSAKCTTDKCWFGFFKCKGRAFTVKVLRRRKDNCVSYVNNKTVTSLEDWVFEERALNFCCECAM